MPNKLVKMSTNDGSHFVSYSECAKILSAHYDNSDKPRDLQKQLDEIDAYIIEGKFNLLRKGCSIYAPSIQLTIPQQTKESLPSNGPK